MPEISVIIPTFNRSTTVVRAVDSVLTQSFSSYELIVIDDGSTDETARVLSPYENKIRYIKQTHSGVSAARNNGISLARGNIITFLDSDDYWLPDKLKVQMDFFRNNQDISIVQTEEMWLRNGLRLNPQKKHKKEGGNIFKRSLELCLISPSAVAMRRELFSEYGMFDEDMPVCEDYDLWLRLTAHIDVGYIPESLIVKTGGHEDQLSQSRWGMDRYRIYSMLKLLATDTELSADQIILLTDLIFRKSIILKAGAIKYSRSEFAAKLDMLLDKITAGCYNCKDAKFLLAE